MNYTNLRLKIRHFFDKYKTILLLAILIWGMIFFFNLLLKNRTPHYEPNITYEAHSSIMDQDNTPKKVAIEIEDVIKDYVDACNDGNYEKAYNMITDDCKAYAFNNSVTAFASHVLSKFPTEKQYAIQSYSTVDVDKQPVYIYQIKYFDDFLSTGLTDQRYSFLQEDMAFFYNDDGELQMQVGDYILHDNIKAISENQYLKLDVIDRVVKYSTETYKVKFTNRSDYTIVVSDFLEDKEVQISLPNETRPVVNKNRIVLKPGQMGTYELTFDKFVDDGESTQNIFFPSIRVMENYSGTGNDIPDEVKQAEIDNAVDKFSMSIKLAK